MAALSTIQSQLQDRDTKERLSGASKLEQYLQDNVVVDVSDHTMTVQKQPQDGAGF